MRRVVAAGWLMVLGIALGGTAAYAQTGGHTITQFGDLKWGPDNKGVSTTIAEGNPRQDGTFTMMLRLADGAWIPPHFHNVDKRLVVVKGELLMGHGDAIDAASATVVPTGGVAVVRANTHHFEGGRGETIVALIAPGPFTTTMIKAGATP
ncbi:MAG: cupin domain-containing protein [Dehalococcoidia bacterium]